MSVPLLNERAKERITEYNQNPCCGQRYNPAAKVVYQATRRFVDPFEPQFEPYIIFGLGQFDMGRTMVAEFPNRLHCSLENLRKTTLLGKLRACCLSSADLSAYGSEIMSAYELLARTGTLHPTKQFHVGATKILHWLFPDLFLMLDRNVARAFRKHFGVKLRDTTQPGYSAQIYLSCLRSAQNEILSFGTDRFRQLEPDSPEARIFDKIAFVVGVRLKVQ